MELDDFFVAAKISSAMEARYAIVVPREMSMFMLPKRVKRCKYEVRLPGRHIDFSSFRARRWNVSAAKK
jgi:hypothetical protein